mmetsp:Transcript_1396/g.4179  ORF Transcript_1396/g.4179 Transcript_1396/m.4179 type:complete len:117 (+) Transcript_1396:1992-2342(+)
MDKTEKTASTNVLLFLQVLDNDVLPLQVIALEAIVDILMVHEMRDEVDGQSQRQMLIVVSEILQKITESSVKLGLDFVAPPYLVSGCTLGHESLLCHRDISIASDSDLFVVSGCAQ